MPDSESNDSSENVTNEVETREDKDSIDKNVDDRRVPSSSAKRKIPQKSGRNDESEIDLPMWVAGSSPAKVTSFDDLMKMSVAMENMALVHEIAINPEFSVKSEPKSALEAQVKSCVEKAYWDKLREEVNGDPADYSYAFRLLLEIKEILNGLIPENLTRLREELQSRLDETILRQQFEKGLLEFKPISEYIIGLLSRLCAPVRDEMIAKLRKETDLVNILRGICEITDVMKIDMANYTVRLHRSIIEEHSAEYEREAFLKILDMDPSGADAVKLWLKRHINFQNNSADASDQPSAKRRFEDLSNSEVGLIINDAFMELLQWNKSNPYPETLILDRPRLNKLALTYEKLLICVSSVLISSNLAGREVSEHQNFKSSLKDELLIILSNDETGKETPTECIESVAVQCVSKTERCLEELKCRGWTADHSKQLAEQIKTVISPENAVRKLVDSRMRSFILEMLSNPSPSSKKTFPPGIGIIADELSSLTASFIRIVSHSRSAFGVFYGKIIKELMSS
ncbi:hypothetical protein AB6A40_002172 [Gnathostoma spinigerum]|uniref:T-complex protein 11-like protein 1 n=1 Tax=Gnathostoma spinigerum TaxID=75299 RepID=A0ABD6EEZ6_9BILA